MWAEADPEEVEIVHFKRGITAHESRHDPKG